MPQHAREDCQFQFTLRPAQRYRQAKNKPKPKHTSQKKKKPPHRFVSRCLSLSRSPSSKKRPPLCFLLSDKGPGLSSSRDQGSTQSFCPLCLFQFPTRPRWAGRCVTARDGPSAVRSAQHELIRIEHGHTGRLVGAAIHLAVWVFSLLFSRGTSPAGTRAEPDWADVCMSRRQMSTSKARLIFARPPALHAPQIPPSTSTKQRPPLALRYSHALSRQICLCLPKYIRTSCPRFSPRNPFTPDHQHQKQQGTSYTSSLQSLSDLNLLLAPVHTSLKPIYSTIHLHGTASTAVL